MLRMWEKKRLKSGCKYCDNWTSNWGTTGLLWVYLIVKWIAHLTRKCSSIQFSLMFKLSSDSMSTHRTVDENLRSLKKSVKNMQSDSIWFFRSSWSFDIRLLVCITIAILIFLSVSIKYLLIIFSLLLLQMRSLQYYFSPHLSSFDDIHSDFLKHVRQT